MRPHFPNPMPSNNNNDNDNGTDNDYDNGTINGTWYITLTLYSDGFQNICRLKLSTPLWLHSQMFCRLGVSSFAFLQQAFSEMEASVFIQSKNILISWFQNSLFFHGT